MSAANAVTLPLAGYTARHVRLRGRRQGRDADAQPAGEEEPAHLRELRRARRHLPRGRARTTGVKAFVVTGAGGNFSLRRRRVRDHRPAGRDGHGRPARLHPHDRRAGQGDARLPAADRRRDRRRVRRRRRDHRDGVGHPHRHRAAPRSRSCSTASGSPAATWAPARCCRASSARAARPNCSTPGACSAARRRSAGASSIASPRPTRVLGEAQALAARARRRTDLRQRHDQAHARDGMGDVGRGGDRGRGGRAGAVHADRGFRPRLSGVRRQAEAGLRGQLRCLDDTLAWPFFDDAPSRLRGEALARWADATLPSLPHDDVDAACRARVQALGEAGFLKAVVPAEHGGLHPRLDVRTLCLAREILGLSRRACRFRLRHAGAGHRLRSRSSARADLKARYLPPVRDGQRHRGLRAVRAGGRLRRRGAGDDRDARRRRACPHRRREDLDLQRRHRRPLRRVRPHRRGAGRQGPVGLRGRRRSAGPDSRRAHRRDRAASARHARASTACACRSPTGSASPAKASRSRWRRSTSSAPRVGAAALGFARRALHESIAHAGSRASCSARRSPTCS